ncbi:MAG: hypothetical protein K9W44_02310 [Candidatus Lokiarchaeota archaeon]|nr:hypothetical protein [Candidatus Harpocratesius repetitus]
MSLTTSDEIQKQLTVVFGYKGYHQIEIGEIRGIGKLSKHHSQHLIKEILEYLSGFSGMLRDFAGCELYSLEFELISPQKHFETRIMPKSMLFIPGIYKDSVSFLLLLAPQLALMDDKKPKESINHINELLYEIEGAIDIPELNKEQRALILQKFATRFTSKLQAEVIETKWNRKMVGLREEDRNISYINMNLEYFKNWKDRIIEIRNPRFGYPRLRLSEDERFEFSKYEIHPSIAYIIAQHSFKLGANLLKIANTGTTDDTQKQIITLILNIFLEKSEIKGKSLDFDQFIKYWSMYLEEIEHWKLIFKENYQKYINKRAFKSLDEIKEDYNHKLRSFNDLSSVDLFQNIMGKILIHHLKNFRYSSISYDRIRPMDLQAPFLYIEESLNQTLKKIKKTYRQYIQIFYFDEMNNKLMELLEENLHSIKKKSTIHLGKKILTNFKKYLETQLQLKNSQISARSQVHLLIEFKKIVKDMLEPFIKISSINIVDLLEFCKKQFESNENFQTYITKLKLFPKEIEFLWGFILRNSTLQQFLKKFPLDLEFTPKSFGDELIKYLLENRMIILNLQWREVFFTYIRDFIQKYEENYQIDKQYDVIWPKSKILLLFMDYVSNRVKKDTSIDGFIEPMKNYLDKIAMSNIQLKDLVEIYYTYIEGLEIINEFPDFLRQIVYISLESFQRFPNSYLAKKLIGPVRSNEEMLSTVIQDMRESFKIEKSFYGFVVEEEMKYFSSILPFPKLLILKSAEPLSPSKIKIDHILEFQNLKDKFVKVSISTNFDKIAPFLRGENHA